MTEEGMTTARTLGELISNRRKHLGLSQKELSAQIIKEEDQKPISPQYLNDIEHDRRTPSSENIITQLAKTLEVQPDYLFFLAGAIPEELRNKPRSEAEVVNMFSAFRRTAK
jgi:transcriptional regulator with XRE-family HTH domain